MKAPRMRDGRFGHVCPHCDGCGMMNAQAYCRSCGGDGVVPREVLSFEFDEYGRRVHQHPGGQRYPMTVGHDPTACMLELPHRGNCWPASDGAS